MSSDSHADRKLLLKALRLFPRLIDRDCGNSEDTPCDDLRPSYVCPLHKWLKEARKAVKP